MKKNRPQGPKRNSKAEAEYKVIELQRSPKDPQRFFGEFEAGHEIIWPQEPERETIGSFKAECEIVWLRSPREPHDYFEAEFEIVWPQMPTERRSETLRLDVR